MAHAALEGERCSAADVVRPGRSEQFVCQCDIGAVLLRRGGPTANDWVVIPKALHQAAHGDRLLSCARGNTEKREHAADECKGQCSRHSPQAYAVHSAPPT